MIRGHTVTSVNIWNPLSTFGARKRVRVPYPTGAQAKCVFLDLVTDLLMRFIARFTVAH